MQLATFNLAMKTNTSFDDLKEDALNLSEELKLATESREILSRALGCFSEEALAYAFLGGSFVYGGGVKENSDIDSCIVFGDIRAMTKEMLRLSIEEYVQAYVLFNKKNNRLPDYVFPGEYCTLAQVNEAIEGRGFFVNSKKQELELPLWTDDDYLRESELWFQPWLTLSAFGIFFSGDIDRFVKNKIRAWEAIILYLLSKYSQTSVTTTIIMKELLAHSETEFRITDDYPLFVEKESIYCDFSLKNLQRKGFLRSENGNIVPDRKKLHEWRGAIIDQAQGSTMWSSSFLFDFDEMKNIKNLIK